MALRAAHQRGSAQDNNFDTNTGIRQAMAPPSAVSAIRVGRLNQMALQGSRQLFLTIGIQGSVHQCLHRAELVALMEGQGRAQV
jgi:hypothetical protein